MANTHSIDLELSSSQYLSIADASQTGLDLTGDFTLECWIKAETNNTTRYVLAKHTSGQTSYILYLTSNGKVGLDVSDNGTTNAGHFVDFVTQNIVIPSTGTWHHIAISYDASETTPIIYVDGVSKTFDTSGTVGTSVFNGTAPFEIGTDASRTYYYDGLIDDVRVWNDIRTGTEISDNYQKELVGNEAGLVAYWKLNDSLLDETSNNNDLTNNNSAVFSTDVPFVGAVGKSFAQII